MGWGPQTSSFSRRISQKRKTIQLKMGTHLWGTAPDAKPSCKARLYPLEICYIAMQRSTIFNGKTHNFYGYFP